MKSLIVSLHDVAPSTTIESQQWMNLLNERNLSISMLVVPGSWRGRGLAADETFCDWLRATVVDSHEVVQHGFSHTIDHDDKPGIFGRVVGNIAARGCQEFWSISETEARNRLHSGLSTLAKVGFRPLGFVAPGWLTSRDAVSAVRRVGFNYLTTHFFVRDLVANKRYFAPVVCQRPNSASTAKIAKLTKLLAVVLRLAKLPVRVAIHPDDLFHAETREAIFSVIDYAIANGYESQTYANFISSRREPNFSQINLRKTESVG